MQRTDDNIITDPDLIREPLKSYPALQEGDDPLILFDPEEFQSALHELKDGQWHAIILRDFFPSATANLREGHIRLIHDFVEANSSTIHVKDRQIMTEFDGEPPITSDLPDALQAALFHFHGIQQRVKDCISPFNTTNIELAAQFGDASVIPPSPDLHTHCAGAMHVTACGSAGLEIMIGEMSQDDMLYLNRLNSENDWDPYHYFKGIADRPDLEARLRVVPANQLIIMGEHLYHRSPTRLMFEGNNRLAFFAL
ncbi:MAG: hypothetical protein AB7E85_04300 [Pseudobdellovibrionaceae bacterium]